MSRLRFLPRSIRLGLLAAVLPSGAFAVPPAAPTDAVTEANALIARVLPAGAGQFVCSLIPADHGRDVFEYESLPSDRIALRGNSALSLAVAFNQYLRREAHLDFDWLATGPLETAGTLRAPTARVRHVCRADERFFLNYCTYGYTFPWWRWDQWQRFLDWMAMNGINRPLLQSGQEAVWLRVWESYGLTDAQVRAYFSGPAHLPWHRMANLDGWGGPLPHSYIDGQRDLQVQILARARALGMTPILSAFAGHVPHVLSTLRPSARITPIAPGWGGLPPAYGTDYLDPTDPLFAEIQQRFLAEQAKLYGTDHLYAADPFNEIDPPSWEPAYLASVARAIVGSMTAADPQARWYQMAWTFQVDKRWTAERLSAMLRAVPADRIVLLDYFCEETEVYRHTDGFFGRPFIWNYLGNFGGNTNLVAPFDRVNRREARALDAAGCIGVGSTLEGLAADPGVYDLVLEEPWLDQPVALADWLARYATTRAARPDPSAIAAWRVLGAKVLTENAPPLFGRRAVLLDVPSLNGSADGSCLSPDLDHAIALLLRAALACRRADGYQFDLVNLCRQALADLGLGAYRRMLDAYRRGDCHEFAAASAHFLEIGLDLDTLVATRREFLFGPWIAQARSWGDTPAEADYYEHNARQILTSWDGPDGGLMDYACRQWNGLIATYYLPRWEKFIQLAARSLASKTPFPSADYANWLKTFANRWENARSDHFLLKPEGDPFAVAERLFRKYRQELAGGVDAAAPKSAPTH